MKVRFPFRIFLLFLSLFVFASAIIAQEKPKALKFDEFEDAAQIPYYVYDEITLAQRAERFIKQLKKERAARAYIIYYHARITEYSGEHEISYRMGKIKSEIQFKANLENEDVVIVDGGYREKRTIEFWIVPKTAAAPLPTPTLDKSETFVCRKIFINDDTPLNQTDTARFSIGAHNFRGIDDYSLTWKVSAG